MIVTNRLANGLRSITHRTIDGARKKHVEARIEELGFILPHKPPKPKGSYIPFTRIGNVIHIAGHLPEQPDGTLITGRLGETLSIEQGQKAAEMAILNLLSTARVACGGNLDNIKQILKVTGFVSSTNAFTSQATVMNGCSDCLGAIWGEQGRHARSALGVNVLPLNVPVEIEAIIEIDESVPKYL